jgi:predicted N-formylglutamate amidohydrolase
MLKPIAIVLTCEHGGNQVPAAYRPLFQHHQSLLRTHRGWDPGTKIMAERWQKSLKCQLHVAIVTRLLVDLNRSPNHPQVFSEVTRGLDIQHRRQLIAQYHHPHRQRVLDNIEQLIRDGKRVLHIGLHSFTPEMDGVVRNAEIGLLYDPRRRWERDFCHRWRASLRMTPGLPRVRMNYPYRGASDGLTTSLRKQFTNDVYAGVELEVNQKIPLAGGRAWTDFQDACLASFSQVLED